MGKDGFSINGGCRNDVAEMLAEPHERSWRKGGEENLCTNELFLPVRKWGFVKGRSGSKSCCGRLPARPSECLHLADEETMNVPSAPRSMTIRRTLCKWTDSEGSAGVTNHYHISPHEPRTQGLIICSGTLGMKMHRVQDYRRDWSNGWCDNCHTSLKRDR